MDHEEWELIGHFSRYRILACGEKRRLQDPETGKIIREYTVPVYRDPADSGSSQVTIETHPDYIFQTEDDT